MADDTQRFDYPTNPVAMYLGGVFLLVCAAVIGFKAALFSPGAGATVFYWMLVGLCVLLSIASFALIVPSFRAPQYIELSPTRVTLPRPFWSRDTVTIPIDKIKKACVMEVEGTKLLTFYHAGCHWLLASQCALIVNIGRNCDDI